MERKTRSSTGILSFFLSYFHARTKATFMPKQRLTWRSNAAVGPPCENPPCKHFTISLFGKTFEKTVAFISHLSLEPWKTVVYLYSQQDCVFRALGWRRRRHPALSGTVNSQATDRQTDRLAAQATAKGFGVKRQPTLTRSLLCWKNVCEAEGDLFCPTVLACSGRLLCAPMWLWLAFLSQA